VYLTVLKRNTTEVIFYSWYCPSKIYAHSESEIQRKICITGTGCTKVMSHETEWWYWQLCFI